ncbi:MAG: hypothetical protein ACRDYE_13950, partial [Acidimicrobiales bacterium]
MPDASASSSRTRRVATDPLGTDPLGTDPLGTDPLTEAADLFVEVGPDSRAGEDRGDSPRTGPTRPATGPDHPLEAPSGRRTGTSSAVRQWVLAGGLYLGLSLALWWRVWTTHPSSVMTCGCTDAGREVWYLEWSAYALAHGHNPWYSQWMLFPRGVNVLADTSVSIIGLIMAPVTWLFGPVVSMNTASTLAPVLTALSMFWLLRRWVRWAPAAFVGGLCYGFSSFVVVQLTFGWLNLSFLALLPLMVGCLDELLMRQRHAPLIVGMALGLLVAAQFLVSSEMLVLVAVVVTIGILVLVAYDRIHDPADLRRRFHHALVGLASFVVVAAILLSVPVGYFLFGPARLGAMVWSTDRPGDLGNTLGNVVTAISSWGPLSATQLEAQMHLFGGYQGPALPSTAYLGFGMVAVLVAGTLVWRHDRRLWFWGAIGVIAAVLSLLSADGEWGPWALVDHLPILDNVWQGRFSAIIDLAAAVMLAFIVEHTWATVRSHPVSRRVAHHHWWAVGAAGVVMAVALTPVAVALEGNVPFTTRSVTIPSWFGHVAPNLTSGQVVLTYPTASASSQTPLVWQAVDRMSFRLAGGGGPAATASRAGRDRPGFDVLQAASVTLYPSPAITAGNLEAVRRAIRDWGV